MNSNSFYNNYHGHTVSDLETVITHMKHINPQIHFIYLVGDSSFDNKFWLSSERKEDAVNGYEYLLDPPKSVGDIAFQINSQIAKVMQENKVSSMQNLCAINAAIEESSIADRVKELMPQDEFVKNHITEEDVLVISMGGNDVALKPSVLTMANMASLLMLNTIEDIRAGPDTAWGMGYFISLFRDGIREYILKMIQHQRPKAVVVSMIYLPDVSDKESWASTTLNLLGYGKNPEMLRAAVDSLYRYAIKKIKIEGVQILYFPMFKILDGTNTDDYVQRVEPSKSGGEKLAKALLKLLLNIK